MRWYFYLFYFIRCVIGKKQIEHTKIEWNSQEIVFDIDVNQVSERMKNELKSIKKNIYIINYYTIHKNDKRQTTIDSKKTEICVNIFFLSTKIHHIGGVKCN